VDQIFHRDLGRHYKRSPGLQICCRDDFKVLIVKLTYGKGAKYFAGDSCIGE